MFELTPRQTQIISLKARGAAHKEIAFALGISPRTVEEHLNNIVKRLNAKNATHAVSLAILQGYISPETIGMPLANIDEYLKYQTHNLQLHVLRDLLARQIIGHSNFDAFSPEERQEFNLHYSFAVSKAQKRSKESQSTYLEVEQMPVSFLEKMEVDSKQRHMFDVWRRYNGSDSRDILQFSDELVLMEVPENPSLPKMYSMGKNSLAAKVLGADWRNEAIKRGEAEQLGSGYNAVIEGQEPVYEWVRYKTHLDDGHEVELTYSRAIFMFKTNAGFPYFATLSKCISFSHSAELQPLRHSETSCLKYLETNNRPLLGTGEIAIAKHLELDR